MTSSCSHVNSEREVYRSIEICSDCRKNEQDWLFSDYHNIFMETYECMGVYGAALVTEVVDEIAKVKYTSIEEEICFFLASYKIAYGVTLPDISKLMFRLGDPLFYLPAEIRLPVWRQTPCPVHKDSEVEILRSNIVLCVGCILQECKTVAKVLKSENRRNKRQFVATLLPDEIVVYARIIERHNFTDNNSRLALSLALMVVSRGVALEKVYHPVYEG